MTPIYSQNGDLIYQSDSEESAPTTTTTTGDNRAVTPHSTSSLSPNPAPQSKMPQYSPSPSANQSSRVESFSPRYSPPNIPNAHSTADSSQPMVSRVDSHSSLGAPSEPLNSFSGHRDSLQSNQGHVNNISNPMNISIPQKFKLSPQSSPTVTSGISYSVPSNSTYPMSGQYQSHSLTNITANPPSY